VRVSVQHGQGEPLERAIVTLIEMPLLNELSTQARGGRGVLEHPVGVRRGEPGGLSHRRVEERARPRPLLAPGHAADDRAGETGEQHHETHEGQGERRSVPQRSGEGRQTDQRDHLTVCDPIGSN
jgi:hypothetical protein